jgi:hypothetical protein
MTGYCLLFTVLFFSASTKGFFITNSYGQDTCGDSAIVNNLSGEWQWIKRVDGTIAGSKTSEPASCYCTRKIMIEKNCTINYYKNDSLMNSSLYVITQDKCRPSEEIAYILNVNAVGECISISNDTLCLSNWMGMDASSANYYVRIKKH